MVEQGTGWTTSSALVQTAAVLFFVIFLILILFYLVRRFGLNQLLSNLHGIPQVQILNRIPLGPRQALIITRWLDGIYILGVGDNSVNLLAGPFTDEEWNSFNRNLEGGTNKSENFSRVFKKLLGQKR